MSKPVYMDYLGARTQIGDVPNDYHFGTTEATAELARTHSGWMHIESVTEDADGVYVHAQLVVARAVLSLHFWRLVARDVVKRVRDWRIG